MFSSSSVALTICALLCVAPLSAEPRAEPIAQFKWHPNIDGFGGISALEVARDGVGFIAVSDDGMLYRGDFLRDPNGDLSNAKLVDTTALVIETGTRPDQKRFRDMEGLAQSTDGVLHISAEHNPRILSYVRSTDIPTITLLPPVEASMPKNVGYEAFAISPKGDFVTLREGSSNIRAPFEIYRSDANGRWTTIYELPRRGGFRPVGADFGPDGHLYILTRVFNGLGFTIRIERVLFDGDEPMQHEHLFESRFAEFDNLEGLATWRDPIGDIRLIGISDDNFSKLQSTIIVEFKVQE